MEHAILYIAASNPTQTYDYPTEVPTDYIRPLPTRPLDWCNYMWAHLGRYWVCGRTYLCVAETTQERPSRSSTFSRIRPRSTFVDQRDHRQYGALSARCSSAA
eukprot:5886041-Pyramimonas_sp.AAC.1